MRFIFRELELSVSSEMGLYSGLLCAARLRKCGTYSFRHDWHNRHIIIAAFGSTVRSALTWMVELVEFTFVHFNILSIRL